MNWSTISTLRGHKTVQRITLTLVLLFVSIRGMAAEIDPLVWKKPTNTPMFREQLATAEFQTRSQSVLAELGDLSKLEQSAIPDHGASVSRIADNGPARNWNLKPGDVLTKVDQHELWGGGLPNPDARRRVTVFRYADGRTQTMSADAGPVGVFIGTHWRPELAYLRTKKLRNSKWDEFVVVGCRSYEADPDLAETAWFQAIRAGYQQDELANICGAAIAMRQGRPLVAADFAYLAREAEPKAAKLVSPMILLRVMLANYKLDDAFELCQRFPDQLTDELRLFRALADMHRARPESERMRDAPSLLAEKRYRDDLFPRCIPLTRDAIDYAPKLRERNGVTLKEGNGHHHPLAFLPPEPARDLEFVVKFSVLEIAAGQAESTLLVAFFPHGRGDERQLTTSEEARLFGVQCFESSRVMLHHVPRADTTLIDAPSFPLALNRQHTIRVICCSGQGEAFLDNQRVLYQPTIPLPSDVPLAAIVRPSGLRVKIESIEFNELIERRN